MEAAFSLDALLRLLSCIDVDLTGVRSNALYSLDALSIVSQCAAAERPPCLPGAVVVMIAFIHCRQ